MITEAEYARDVAPIVQELKNKSKQYDMPMFVSCGIEDGDDIRYANEVTTLRAANIDTKKRDYIAEYMKICNGFVATPTSASIEWPEDTLDDDDDTEDEETED